jgi:hypothetical protein
MTWLPDWATPQLAPAPAVPSNPGEPDPKPAAPTEEDWRTRHRRDLERLMSRTSRRKPWGGWCYSDPTAPPSECFGPPPEPQTVLLFPGKPAGHTQHPVPPPPKRTAKRPTKHASTLFSDPEPDS